MSSAAAAAALATGGGAIGLLAYIAWYDFRYLQISNRAILALLGLYALYAALTGFGTLAGDLGAGVILFVPGFAMWVLRLMGAGDVKLYFGLGLFMGIGGLWIFAILLLLVSLLFLLGLYIARFANDRPGVVGRLREIRASGHAPYAVIMCSAAIPVIVMRLIAGA